MIQAIALDDEPPSLRLIEHYCAQTEDLQLLKTFTMPSEALKYLRSHPIDLLFLDIQMPEILGTEFRKKLDPNLLVVFTTAYSNYAVDGFNLNAVDFLLKPFSLERFGQAIHKVKNLTQSQKKSVDEDKSFIYLRADYSLVSIPLNEITYIEGLEDYCKIHYDNASPMIFRITMKALLDKLPSSYFIRIHRSYIVRVDKIKKTRNNIVYINDNELPIGKLFKADLLSLIKEEF